MNGPEQTQCQRLSCHCSEIVCHHTNIEAKKLYVVVQIKNRMNGGIKNCVIMQNERMVVFWCNCVGWNVICVDCMGTPPVTVSHGGDSECSGIVGDWCPSEQTRTPGGNALTPTLGIAAPIEWTLLSLKQSSCSIYIDTLCLRWCCHPPYRHREGVSSVA